MQIVIDNEFRALIPPLSADERAQLEANILADGCRDPLVVWAGVLIDGHNRYEICTKHYLPFKTVETEFDGREQAVEWIIRNQFGRRNLSDYQRGVLALRLKPIMEARARASQIRKPESVSPKSDEQKPVRTDTAVADLANLGKDTIRKIERIEEVARPEVKALASAGEVSINLASQFADLPAETQQAAIFREFHADHAGERPFARIFDTFFDGIDFESVGIEDVTTTQTRFSCRDLAARWQDYHRERAELVVIHAHENLGKKKEKRA